MRTLERKWELFSKRITFVVGEASAQVMAAKNPAAPPPTITTRFDEPAEISGCIAA
jgi:hypothetical protein